MTNPPRAVLAPDDEGIDYAAQVQLNQDGKVFLTDDGHGVIRLDRTQARHLRDWLCEQFGVPGNTGDL